MHRHQQRRISAIWRHWAIAIASLLLTESTIVKADSEAGVVADRYVPLKVLIGKDTEAVAIRFGVSGHWVDGAMSFVFSKQGEVGQAYLFEDRWDPGAAVKEVPSKTKLSVGKQGELNDLRKWTITELEASPGVDKKEKVVGFEISPPTHLFYEIESAGGQHTVRYFRFDRPDQLPSPVSKFAVWIFVYRLGMSAVPFKDFHPLLPEAVAKKLKK